MHTDEFLGATKRRISEREHLGAQARVIELSRSFASPIELVWDVVTTASHIATWFLPITGNLKLGGQFQLEGNAGGNILACEPSTRLELTWEFMEDMSWVTLNLSSTGNETVLTLEHLSRVAEEMWAFYGPGTVGIGWDMVMFSLDRYLRQEAEWNQAVGQAWMASPSGKAFMRESSAAWGEASKEFGTPGGEAAAAADRIAAMYADGIARGDKG